MRKKCESVIWSIVIILACIYITNLWVSLLFILVHELAHYITGKKLGLAFNKGVFLPFGIRFGFKEEFIDPWKDILVSLSGPFVNFLFFALFLWLSRYWGNLNLFWEVNLLLCIFNLVPASFLDGGRIMKAALSLRNGIYYGHLITSINGIILGVFIVINTFMIPFSPSKLSLLMLGTFLLYKSIFSLKHTTLNVIKELILRNNRVNLAVNYKVIMKAYHKDSKILDIIKNFCFNKYYVIYIIDNGYLRYNINETDLVNLFCTYGNICLEECVNLMKTQEEYNG